MSTPSVAQLSKFLPALKRTYFELHHCTIAVMQSPSAVESEPLSGVIAAFLALESPEECSALLDALLAESELDQLPVRWNLLKVQVDDHLSQRKLAKLKGVAPVTAARAQKVVIRHGAFLNELFERVDRKNLLERHE